MWKAVGERVLAQQLEGKASAWQLRAMVWWNRALVVSAKLARRPSREEVASRDVWLKWPAWCGGERSHLAAAVSAQGGFLSATGRRVWHF